MSFKLPTSWVAGATPFCSFPRAPFAKCFLSNLSRGVCCTKRRKKKEQNDEGNMSVQISDTDHRNFMCKGEKTTKEIGQFRYLIQSIGILCG